jgi:hypothetical protein
MVRPPSVKEPLKSFTIEPGRCFRMVRDPVPERRGHKTHCPEPVVASGRFRSEGKKTYTVDACAEHAGELECH